MTHKGTGLVRGSNLRACPFCHRNIHATKAPWRSHLRKHVREGTAREIKHKTLTDAVKFEPHKFAWWGYVLQADGKLVTVRSFSAPHSSVTVERYKTGGPLKPGDAVKLTYTESARGSGFERGMWYAHPLGYEAEWLN